MTRGGRRPGSGRKPRGSAPARAVSVPLAPEERAEIAEALVEGEDLAVFMRDAALSVARGRAMYTAYRGKS